MKKYLFICLVIFGHHTLIAKAIDAGPDITYVVGSGNIDLFKNASVTTGTWSVSGGFLRSNMWEVPYQYFNEPYIDYVATLTLNGETDTKNIRAYNALDPSNLQRSPFTICENGGLNLQNLITKPVQFPRFTNFYKEYYYNKNNSGVWIEVNNSSIKGSELGPGTHTIRERYINVVLPFVYTDVETNVTVKEAPILFWTSPIPPVCTSDGPIDVAAYLNTTTNVVLTCDAPVAFVNNEFYPGVSGIGEFYITAYINEGGCGYSHSMRVLVNCN